MSTHNQQKRLFVTALTDTATTDVEGVGTLRWDGESCFRWVYNDTGSATVVGEVVFHDLSDAALTITHNAIAAATADLSAMAGVCMAICASASYMWIQVLGFCTSALVLEDTGTVTSIGDYLKGVNANVAATYDAESPATYCRNLQALAVMTSTTAVTATMAVMVNCL